MDQLFLLQAGFSDPQYPDRTFICPHCTLIEGVLALYPALSSKIEVRRVPFARPRKEVIDVVGEAFQSLPLLVLAPGKTSEFRTGATGSREFISDASGIVSELRSQYGIAELHP